MTKFVVASLILLCCLCTRVDAKGGPDNDGVMLDRIVAIAEDDAIMESELEQRVNVIKQQFANRASKLPPPAQLRRQVLQRMVLESLQLQVAQRRGIHIDDPTLNDAMRGLAKQNHASLQELRKRLLNEGIDYVKFRDQVRDELTISKLRQQVINSQIQVTDKEIDNLLANQSSSVDSDIEYHLRHILIAIPEGAGPQQIRAARERAEKVDREAKAGADFGQLATKVSDSDNALEGGDLGWRKAGELPSLFARSVTRMQPGDISHIIRSPSGFHIIGLMGRRGGKRMMVNQTDVRHILVKPNALISDKEARVRLANLRGRIEAGASFAALAKANSDDKASAVDGGDLGWVDPGVMTPDFQRVMDRVQVGQISQPFHTQYGWHILQVTGRRRHDSTSEMRRAQARKVIEKRKAEEQTELYLRRLRDESYVDYRLRHHGQPG